jgi:CheY-like chemotaxis protein
LEAFAPPSRKRKAFVAEDAPDTRTALQLLLENEGFEVAASASSESEALAWLDQHPGEWDLAIVDLLLLEGSGFNVLRRCKQGPDAGKVIVFSAFLSEPVRARCEQLGADAVIMKTDIPQLVKILDAFRPRP